MGVVDDTARPTHGTRFAVLAMPILVVLWSNAFVAGVIGVDAAPPLLLMLGRFGISGILLAGYALVVKSRWPRGSKLGHLIVSGLLMQAVQFGAFYTALAFSVPAAMVSLMQGMSPVIIAMAAGPLLGEKIHKAQWWGIGLGATGVGLAVADRVSFSPTGFALCLVGLAGLSLGTLYQKRYVPHMDVRTGTSVQLLAAAAATGALSAVTETWRISDPLAFSATLAWLVVINSIAVFVLLNTMLNRSSASKVSTMLFMTPATTAVMAWLLIDQQLHILAVAGVAVAGAGLLVANKKPALPTPPA